MEKQFDSTGILRVLNKLDVISTPRNSGATRHIITSTTLLSIQNGQWYSGIKDRLAGQSECCLQLVTLLQMCTSFQTKTNVI